MKISIVTPSFNQASHLRETLDSVLSQRIKNLEYLVIDGGSTDGSREILEEYSSKLSHWCSEPDKGQYDAVNKGFEKSTGEIMGWLNSSDFYLPWTLKMVEQIFTQFPDVQWISSMQKSCVSEEGYFEYFAREPGFSGVELLKGFHGGLGKTSFIQQESCFWRRSLWEKIGGRITDRYPYAADFWLWSEFFQHAGCVGVDAPLAAFRYHGNQKSIDNRYMKETDEIISDLNKHGAAQVMLKGYRNLLKDFSDASRVLSGNLHWKMVRYEDDQLEKSTLITNDYANEIEYYKVNMKYLKSEIQNILEQVEVLQKSFFIRIGQYLKLCLTVDIADLKKMIKS